MTAQVLKYDFVHVADEDIEARFKRLLVERAATVELAQPKYWDDIEDGFKSFTPVNVNLAA